MSHLTLSILDLATVSLDASGDPTPGKTPRTTPIGEALQHSVELARTAETAGYSRVWYAEHHNMPSIASSAPAVLIAHVAAHTDSIGLGSGGVMLPNHSPLVIAEQFGMLAELHPGRIHLGLGRAPGTDGATFRALRRSYEAADAFPADVAELRSYLSDDLPRSAVNAYPGRGTRVPITILGSSLFGASLAAQAGLPYSFASHFAPEHLQAAVSHYRENYRPSAEHPEPYVSAGINVSAAATDAEASNLFRRTEVSRVRSFLSRGRDRQLTIGEAESLMETPAGLQIRGMMRYSAVGSPERVHDQLAEFAAFANVDELVTVHAAPTQEERLASIRYGAA